MAKFPGTPDPGPRHRLINTKIETVKLSSDEWWNGKWGESDPNCLHFAYRWHYRRKLEEDEKLLKVAAQFAHEHLA